MTSRLEGNINIAKPINPINPIVSIVFILCSSEEEAKKYVKILEHPLYVFINNICRWGNFNNIRILQRFPIAQSYDDIYTSFKITEEET